MKKESPVLSIIKILLIIAAIAFNIIGTFGLITLDFGYLPPSQFIVFLFSTFIMGLLFLQFAVTFFQKHKVQTNASKSKAQPFFGFTLFLLAVLYFYTCFDGGVHAVSDVLIFVALVICTFSAFGVVKGQKLTTIASLALPLLSFLNFIISDFWYIAAWANSIFALLFFSSRYLTYILMFMAIFIHFNSLKAVAYMPARRTAPPQQAPAPKPASTLPPTEKEQLDELNQLFKNGEISEEEYSKRRAEVLGIL